MEKEEKIIALEEKIAWLEEQLDAQANELNNIYDKMDKLERQFRILYSKVGDPYATRAMKDEVLLHITNYLVLCIKSVRNNKPLSIRDKKLSK